MNSRSSLGKTSKYSGVVKNVQGAKPPEEPRITPEQVVAAFRSFGFEPNQRNHNDIAYWTLKGQSEGQKLIDELSKRRKDLNQEEDDNAKAEKDRNKAKEDILRKHEETKASLLDRQNQDKITMPRLSDKDIEALFDEYGLPTPDPEWTRNHLPNDPKKIRSILEMQRKTADEMMKKHSKNAVNAIPETPKMGGAPMPAAPAPMMGQGGPTPMGMSGDMGQGTDPETPFFIGDHSIVRITDPRNPNRGTTWLVDAKKKVLRPFASEQAFRNAFENPEDAEKAVTVVTTRDFAPGGPLHDFTPLQGTKGVKDDGSMDDIEFSPAELQNRYGQPENPEAENKAMNILDGVLGQVNQEQ